MDNLKRFKQQAKIISITLILTILIQMLQPFAIYASEPETKIYKEQKTQINKSTQNYKNNGNKDKVWVPPVYKEDKVLVPESYKETKKWVPDTYKNVKKWVGETYKNVKKWVPDTYRNVKKWVGSTYRNVKKWVPDTYRNVKKWVGATYKNVKKYVPTTYKSVKKYVPTSYKYTKKYVSGYYKSTRKYVSGYYKTVSKYVPGKIKSAWSWLKGKWKKITTRAKGYYKRVKTYVRGRYKTVKSYVRGYYRTVKQKVGGYYRTIKQKVGGYYKTVKQKVAGYYKTVKQKVKGYYKTVKQKVAGYYKTVKEKVKGYYKTVKEKVSGYYKTVKQKVAGYYKTVKETIPAYYKKVKTVAKEGYWKTTEAVKKSASKAISYLPSIGTVKSVVSGSLSVLQTVGGVVQIGVGVALTSTGIGAVIGVPLIAHGAADVVQGTLNTYNEAVGNGKEAKNFMQEVYKWIGNKIGGETGEKIANGVFTVADIGLGFVSVGGTIKHLTQIKQLDKGTDIAKYLVKIGADGGKKALTIINPKNIYKAGKEVAGNMGTKTINLAGDLKKELAQIAEIYRKQGKGTVALSSNGAGELQKVYDTLAEYAKVRKADDGAKVGSKIVTKYWNETIEFKKIKVYKRDDIIDPDMIDGLGRSNLQRMKVGIAPIGSDRKSINLHHMIQTNDSAIAEVTQTFHQQNSKVIHINPNTTPSGIDRTQFNTWKRNYWKNRAKDFK